MNLSTAYKALPPILLMTIALLTGCGGGSTSKEQPPATPAPPTVQITALPVSIQVGGTSTLSWSSKNATSVSISPAVAQGTLATSGSQTVTPTVTTTYTISATGVGGTATATATVTVKQLPSVTLTISPGQINTGQSALLQWTSTNATSVTITPSVLLDEQKNLPLNGSTAILPDLTQASPNIYTITATGPGGTQTATAQLNYIAVPPTAQLIFHPASIKLGQSSTVTWTTTNATGILIQNQYGERVPLGTSRQKAQFGSAVITPAHAGPNNYAATASNSLTNLSGASLPVTLNVSNFTAALTSGTTVIQPNQPATLNYAVTTDAGETATISIDNGVGTQSQPTGSITVLPNQTTTYTLTAAQANGITTTATATVAVAGALESNIQHVILLVQGGHSFDNYFGKLGLYKAKNGLPNDIDGIDDSSDPRFSIPDAQSPPQMHNPFHLQTVCLDEQPDAWNEAHQSVDLQGGTYKMDGFLLSGQYSTGRLSIPPAQPNDPLGLHLLGHYDENDIPYYYDLATQFATSDSWFSPVLGDEAINRMYVLAATSYGTTYSGSNTTPGAYLQPTIFTQLTEAGISWRYYTQDVTNFISKYSSLTPNEFAHNIRPISEYFALLAGMPSSTSPGPPSPDTALPQVIFIERGAEIVDTDEYSDIQKNLQPGVFFVSQAISALTRSTYWPTSVFFLSYDDADGFYDHVAPHGAVAPDDQAPSQQPPAPTQTPNGAKSVAPGDFTSTGLRVPLVVVSPWVKQHYVSHVPRDNTALLKFIETRFASAGVKSLTKRDAAQDDMTEIFDFAPASLPLLVPPPMQLQPTGGVCQESKETLTNQP